MIETVITRNLTAESSNAGWVHDEVTVDLPVPYRTATVTSALVWTRGGGQAKAAIVAYEYEVYDKYGLPTGQMAAYLRLEPPPINSEEIWLKHGHNSVTVTGLQSIIFELSAKDMFVSATFTIFVHKAPSIFRRFEAFFRRLLPGVGRG